ncbi:MAG: hypothetical protein QXT73_05870, partial [Candidatus Methanomethylicaceae archaeon]
TSFLWDIMFGIIAALPFVIVMLLIRLIAKLTKAEIKVIDPEKLQYLHDPADARSYWFWADLDRTMYDD